jgi:nitrogenase-associated protein
VTAVAFFEKPGCVSNARQRTLLAAHGHSLEVRDLLRERWTAEGLRPFFGTRPVADWFNPTAPRIKSGELDPATLDEATALALMVTDPILIRRPLLITPNGLCAGFERGPVLAALGIDLAPEEDLQSCSRPDLTACPPPTGAAA